MLNDQDLSSSKWNLTGFATYHQSLSDNVCIHSTGVYEELLTEVNYCIFFQFLYLLSTMFFPISIIPHVLVSMCVTIVTWFSHYFIHWPVYLIIASIIIYYISILYKLMTYMWFLPCCMLQVFSITNCENWKTK